MRPARRGRPPGLVFYALFRWLGLGPLAEGIVIVAIFVVGAWSGTLAETALGTTDPGAGVIDEVAGMLVTLYLLPVTWTIAIVGFFVFRVLDVFKPFPARQLESLHGGWGMMADDVMAAIYGNLILRAAIYAAPTLFVR